MGGCHGNLQGISKLVQGMTIDEVIDRLKGIKCGFKPTSCPDQLAKALEEYKNKI
ncbi:MAG: TIGR03905 family TSCPD domain-containing protein [Clostridia bacterium]|nr:TIGR03905 family TSCPD domain-containing protein [Clostridia bacterium]